MAEVVIRLAAKKIASTLFKEGIEYGLSKREAEKRNKAIINYASKVTNINERNALVLFNTIEGTEKSIEELRGKLESGDGREKSYWKCRNLKDSQSALSRMPQTPSRMKVLENLKFQVPISEYELKLYDEPDFRDKMIKHFYNISKEL
jgi:hypothetical protein